MAPLAIALIQKDCATVETMGDPTAEGFDVARFAAWDRMTLAEFLKGQGASAAAVDLTQRLDLVRARLVDRLGAPPAGLGPRALLISASGRRWCSAGTTGWRRAFADALRERIWYGAPVTEVLQEGDKVRAVFREGGRPQQAIEADRLGLDCSRPSGRGRSASPPSCLRPSAASSSSSSTRR